jgi:WhiB family redox-sensing transcriptional regulator
MSRSTRVAPPCAAHDPELFFPDSPEQLALARTVCAGCPLRAACLEEAVATGTSDGVWGGVLLERGVVVEVKRRPGRPRKIAA